MVRGASRNTPLEIETICVHMYLPATCICFYVHTHIHTHTPMQTCVSMLTDVYIKVCTLIDPHLHTCITQAHTHACTHTHTYTQVSVCEAPTVFQLPFTVGSGVLDLLLRRKEPFSVTASESGWKTGCFTSCSTPKEAF